MTTREEEYERFEAMDKRDAKKAEMRAEVEFEQEYMEEEEDGNI